MLREVAVSAFVQSVQAEEVGPGGASHGRSLGCPNEGGAAGLSPVSLKPDGALGDLKVEEFDKGLLVREGAGVVLGGARGQ